MTDEKCTGCGSDAMTPSPETPDLHGWECGSFRRADGGLFTDGECVCRQLAAAKERIEELEVTVQALYKLVKYRQLTRPEVLPDGRAYQWVTKTLDDYIKETRAKLTAKREHVTKR